jgi:hypothetical protein
MIFVRALNVESSLIPTTETRHGRASTMTLSIPSLGLHLSELFLSCAAQPAA